jgi:hypothetical protein
MQWLVGIVVLGGGYAIYSNLPDSSSSSAPVITAPTPASAPMIRTSARTATASHRVTSHNQGSEFQPRLGPKTPEDRPDPATIDPTLRLDLLAKVQKVELGAPGRNLFDFGAAPPPDIALPTKVAKIDTHSQPVQPVQHVGPVGPPQPPPAPQIALKYYGYKISTADGHKAAFLMDGEDILVAGENDTVKRRYKVVRIGVNSITIEDTQFKSTQTLPLQEAPAA